MEVEPNVIKKELTDLKHVAQRSHDIKKVAVKLDDIGFDHIPTTQYRSGTQIKTDLLTHVSDLVATAKQGENVNAYIKRAQRALNQALNIKLEQVYSKNNLTTYSLNDLIKSIDQDLQKLN